MSKAASVIEINGNRYDANSGDVIGSVKRFARQVKDQSNTRVIDGFVKRPAAAVLAVHTKKPGAVAVHARAEKSRTLMRSAVARPSNKQLSSRITSKEPAKPEPAPVSRIIKNAKVRRFGQLPSADAANNPSEVSARNHSSASATSANPSAHGAVLPSLMSGVSHQRLERMLDEALIRADAHKNMLAHHSKNPIRFMLRHRITAALAVIIVIASAGLLAWQRLPALSMQVAAKRAGLSATLPSYVPDSFKVTAPVNYSSGAVRVHYASTVNSSQNYTLSEQKSTWDSASLQANMIGKNSQSQTSQIGGTTVYIYGASNNATWVNSGIHYTLDDHANLSSDQLLHIAENM